LIVIVISHQQLNSNPNPVAVLWSSYVHFGKSSDKLRYPRSVAYLVEPVLLNKHQISGRGTCVNC